MSTHPSAPTPTVFQVVFRALFAGVLTECSVAVLAFLWWAELDGPPGLPLVAISAAFGLGLGVAFALAELGARTPRVGALVGLGVGLLAAILAPLGGAFAFAFLVKPNSLGAMAHAVASLDAVHLQLAACGWLLVYGTLLLLRRLEASLGAEVGGAAVGACLAAGVGLAWGLEEARLTVDLLLLIWIPRALWFPILLRAGDRVATAILRRLAGQEAVVAEPAPRPSWRAGAALALASFGLGALLVGTRGDTPETLRLRLAALQGAETEQRALAKHLLAWRRERPASRADAWTPARAFSYAGRPDRLLRHERRRLRWGVAILERQVGPGDVATMLELADFYGSHALGTRGAERRAREWLGRAIEARPNDPKLCWEVANRLAHGHGDPRTTRCFMFVGSLRRTSPESLRWMRRAGRLGHLGAQTWLAQSLDHWGDEASEREAIRWYRRLLRHRWPPGSSRRGWYETRWMVLIDRYPDEARDGEPRPVSSPSRGRDGEGSPG